jgi:hypothetical protein
MIRGNCEDRSSRKIGAISGCLSGYSGGEESQPGTTEMTTSVGFEPVDSLTAVHNRNLGWLQAMVRGGSELAPAAALFYCYRNKVSAPDWVTEAASVSYCKALNGTFTKKLGRSSGPVERYQQDMIDFARWEAVSYVRGKQRTFPEEVKELRSRPNIPKAILEENGKKLKLIGKTWLSAFQFAITLVRGTPAFGGVAAMKASYYRVEKNSKAGRLRYHLLDPSFLSSVGLVHPMFWKPVRKVG